MKSYPSLKIVDVFKGVFQRFGVDYPAMRRILQIKLTMDRRRMPTVFNEAGRQNKDNESNQFLKSLWIYAFLGLVLIPFILIRDSYILPMTLVYGVLMFLLMTSMISDFSQVLLDIRDKNILNTKPVNRRTVNAAKMVHVSIYMFILTGTITGIPLLVSLLARGWPFFIVFLGQIILIDLLIVVVTALLYILVLRFFDGEKLKDIINYVQIALSLSIVVGYQLVIRSFEIFNLDFTFAPQWWQVFLPPVWYGALFETLLGGSRDIYLIVFSILAVTVPFLSIYIYIRAIPSFERNLEKLSHQEQGKKKKKGRLGRFLCKTREEEIFYYFARKMMKNERQFKLKVYPVLGLSFVIPFILIFNEVRMSSFEEVAASRYYLSVYFSAMMIPTVILMLRYSENFKGSWVYKALPVTNRSPIVKGTLKAFIVALYVPVFTALSGIFMFIFSVNIFPDLIVVWLVSSLYVLFCFKVLNGELMPFSESFEMAQQETGKVLFLFVPILVLYGIHFWVGGLTFGTPVYGAVLFVANMVLWRRL
ncbi:hypothetical protein [Salipaludibacillus aurantiacus]|uniref:ABC-2 type transport system permease protein n=1 Tax=Salipaludibacillus aurantiacus TaxID=1601833 RepID=A0A1H9TV99_9BACI|nr:hypothetical protein [Salipaludibacillus aurantiacus]SES01039.1 hypothetical protein SAMN05518684_106107 [Salipaludibacillus aurantiacus]